MKQKVITLIIILIIILVIILVIKWILFFPLFFFAVWPGGRRCANCRDVHFFWEVLWWKHLHMKNIQNNNGKKKPKTKSSDPWARSGERPGRGHGSELFFVFPWFFAVWPKPREHKKNKKNKKFRPMGKVWAIHTQTKKNKKTKNQETKKPKKQKTKKTKKTKIAHPKGRGSDAECWVLSFWFFCFFCFFWFFGFLVCVWIAIADVPSRDCQALSVVALEARSIHYSTAMFAMT